MVESKEKQLLAPLLVEVLDDSVPEADSRLESLLGSHGGLFPAAVVVAATELSHHHQGHRPVVLAVDFDVSLEVDDERVQGALHALVHVAEEAGEHEGDEVFTAEGKGRGHDVQFSGSDELEGGADEAGGRGRGIFESLGQGGVGDVAFLGDGGQHLLDSLGGGAGGHHGLKVELEVGDVLLSDEVALLPKDDLVDESSGDAGTLGTPWHTDTGQFALEVLEDGRFGGSGEEDKP